jgi:ribosomal protein L11 methyltransferase
MKWMELKAVLEPGADETALELISECFREAGVQGVVLEDPSEQPAGEWHHSHRPVEAAPPAVIGYFPENERLAERTRALEAGLKRVEARAGISSRIAFRSMDEQDWAESWKQFFWPEKIGRRLVVKPTWRQYAAGPQEVVMEIDPGMAFGTGTHPTTAMCLRGIEARLKTGDRFLDVGTGSGILMVAAARLGASRVVGVDTDEVAVDVARRNLALNGIAEATATVHCGDLLKAVAGRFDLVAANILTPVILMLLPDLRSVMADGARVICSGITLENRQRVIAALKAHGMAVLEDQTQEEWVAITASAPQPDSPL